MVCFTYLSLIAYDGVILYGNTLASSWTPLITLNTHFIIYTNCCCVWIIRNVTWFRYTGATCAIPVRRAITYNRITNILTTASFKILNAHWRTGFRTQWYTLTKSLIPIVPIPAPCYHVASLLANCNIYKCYIWYCTNLDLWNTFTLCAIPLISINTHRIFNTKWFWNCNSCLIDTGATDIIKNLNWITRLR